MWRTLAVAVITEWLAKLSENNALITSIVGGGGSNPFKAPGFDGAGQ